jgi:gliding motility-associated-like protein
VYPKPIANYGLQTSVACDLLPVHFIDSSQADTPLTYLWSFGDGQTSNQQNPFHTYPSVGGYFTNLIITTTHGCVDTFALPTSLTVFPLPQAAFILTPTDTSIFYPDITMTDQSTGATGCTVFWGDGATYTNCDSLHHFGKPGTYTVMQVVVNASGCYDTAYSEVIIRPEFLFWLPNAFTPNGNGVNDIFKPVVLGVHDYSFLVFDRWGEKIFETNNISDGWNGYYKGNLCSNDVYVYKITFRDDVLSKLHEYIGRVTLVR